MRLLFTFLIACIIGCTSRSNNYAIVTLNNPPKVHSLVEGDSLFSLAEKYYGQGNGLLVYSIVHANRSTLDNNSLIKVGMNLNIPTITITNVPGDRLASFEDFKGVMIFNLDVKEDIGEKDPNVVNVWKLLFCVVDDKRTSYIAVDALKEYKDKPFDMSFHTDKEYIFPSSIFKRQK